MQRGGSINPASFLQKPQFNVHDPSLSCFMVVDAVGILHTMSKKKKKRSDCSRTQTCSWNLCVNSWKYCWLLSRTKAWDMVDLIFYLLFETTFCFMLRMNSLEQLCHLFWYLRLDFSLQSLHQLYQFCQIMRGIGELCSCFLLISVVPCYASGATLSRLRGCLGELRLLSLACLCCWSIGFCNLFSK